MYVVIKQIIVTKKFDYQILVNTKNGCQKGWYNIPVQYIIVNFVST